ncbi:MAG: helix-turn-helix domain-containing protein [Sedimenticola sp.]
MSDLIQPFVPVMTQERFSELCGLTEATVRGMIEKGHIPAIKIGKRRMINIAELSRQAVMEEA